MSKPPLNRTDEGDPMTTIDERLTGIEAHLSGAHTEIGEVAARDRRRFRMSIPARPEYDTDLIISRALTEGEQAIATVRAVLALHTPEPTYKYADACGHDVDESGYDDRHREAEDGEGICLDSPNGANCSQCFDQPGDYIQVMSWPCPTVRAITAGLATP